MNEKDSSEGCYSMQMRAGTAVYRKSLKAAMRTAAKAPVASCWGLARDEDEADAAEADAEVAFEEAAADVDEADDEAEADEEEPEPELPPLTPVAFWVPHFSLFVHVA